MKELPEFFKPNVKKIKILKLINSFWIGLIGVIALFVTIFGLKSFFAVFLLVIVLAGLLIGILKQLSYKEIKSSYPYQFWKIFNYSIFLPIGIVVGIIVGLFFGNIFIASIIGGVSFAIMGVLFAKFTQKYVKLRKLTHSEKITARFILASNLIAILSATILYYMVI